MNRFSINLGTYAGIPVKLHWTFWLIFLIVAYAGWMEGMDVPDIAVFMLLTVCLFFCVLLHEYGHALTAARYGIGTQDIILSPIGGIARMRKMPDDPVQEIVVALAGPAVNVLICITLGLLIWLIGWDFFPVMETPSFRGIEIFTVSIFWMNAILFVFNLIPAFPMDGGRVLRAVLALRWSKLRATQIAAYAGQVIAAVFILIGLWNYQFVLPFIGVFIIITGKSELNNARQKHLYLKTTAEDIMKRKFLLEFPDSVIHESFSKADAGGYDNIVVQDYHGRVFGSLLKSDLQNSLLNESLTFAPISYLTVRPSEVLYSHQSVNEIIQLFNKYNSSSLPVMSGNIVVGVIDRDRLREWLNG